MAWELITSKFTGVVGFDASTTGQYRFVKVNTSGAYVLCGAGDKADAILQDNPISGESGEMANGGVSKVVLGADVTAGDLVTSDTNGAAVTAASSNSINGRALVSGVAGDIASVLCRMQG